MKALTLSDPALLFGLQDEIRRSEDSRYDHRLHALVLVARGMSAPEVAKHFGDSRTSVWGWIRRFEEKGFGGLMDELRSGRPKRLSDEDLEEIGQALRSSPPDGGLWDGKTLSAYILKKYSIHLGVRQCQRLFKKLGFRFRKPRPMLSHADPEAQKRFKKNSRNS